MRILSVCSYGNVRSCACQKLVGGEILPGGINQARSETVRQWSEWADVILVMTEIHYGFFKQLFPEFLPKIRTLGISDQYGNFLTSPILDQKLRDALKRNQIPILFNDHKNIN